MYHPTTTTPTTNTLTNVQEEQGHARPAQHTQQRLAQQHQHADAPGAARAERGGEGPAAVEPPCCIFVCLGFDWVGIVCTDSTVGRVVANRTNHASSKPIPQPFGPKRTDGQRGERRGDGAAHADDGQGVEAHGVGGAEEGEVGEEGVGEGGEQEALLVGWLVGGCVIFFWGGRW